MNVSQTKSVGQASIGLISLIKEAVGPKNIYNIHENFFSKQFRKKGILMDGKPLIAPFLDGETGYGAMNRLAAHYTGKNFEFSNTFSLARYMIDNSAEISKFAGVLAMSGDSLWESPDSHADYAPYAFVSGDRRRSFSFYELGAKFSSRQGILLFGPNA